MHGGIRIGISSGILDEVGVFNVPLSESDLNNVMKNGLEGAADVSPVGKLATTWGDVKGVKIR